MSKVIRVLVALTATYLALGKEQCNRTSSDMMCQESKMNDQLVLLQNSVNVQRGQTKTEGAKHHLDITDTVGDAKLNQTRCNPVPYSYDGMMKSWVMPHDAPAEATLDACARGMLQAYRLADPKCKPLGLMMKPDQFPAFNKDWMHDGGPVDSANRKLKTTAKWTIAGVRVDYFPGSPKKGEKCTDFAMGAGISTNVCSMFTQDNAGHSVMAKDLPNPIKKATKTFQSRRWAVYYDDAHQLQHISVRSGNTDWWLSKLHFVSQQGDESIGYGIVIAHHTADVWEGYASLEYFAPKYDSSSEMSGTICGDNGCSLWNDQLQPSDCEALP